MYSFGVVVLEMIREQKPSFELPNLWNTTYAWLFHKRHFSKVRIFFHGISEDNENLFNNLNPFTVSWMCQLSFTNQSSLALLTN
jgi:hypothetical protein